MALEKIGALWLKEGKKGGKYMSGKITIGGEEIRLTVFKNRYKDTDNKPDYIINQNIDDKESQPPVNTRQPETSSDAFSDIPF